jgi:Tfp pilus assembly protein PilF
VSVILDALRRARTGDERKGRPDRASSDGSRVRVPAGLGLSSSPLVNRTSPRGRWLVVAAVLAIAAVIIVAINTVQSGDPRSRPIVPATQRAASKPVASPPPRVDAAAHEAQPSPASATEVPSRAPNAVAPTPAPIINHFEAAVRQHTAGNLDEAAKQYLAAIADDDRNVEARNNLGLLYRSRGQTNEAIEQFTRALAIDLRYVNARNHLAVMLIETGRLTEARTHIDAGLAIDPRNVDLLVNEALLEKAERHPERAIELLLRALAEQPTHAAAHYNLALLYDERHSLSLAYSHYTDFLNYAGPEYRAVVADVKQRAQVIRAASIQQPSR